MIQRYSDHAANERTFLAWIRTAIAVAAFGFLVEKFDLFLVVAGHSQGGKSPSPVGQALADITGLLLIALGAAMMVLATVRFRRTAADIDAEATRAATGARLDAALVGLLLLFNLALFAYVAFSILNRP